MSPTIRPFGILRDYLQGEREAQVAAGQTVRQALVSLGIPPEVVALVIVNEQPQEKDYLLEEGDQVKILAVVGGG
ncbi:MAG: MoaD/ThiS family protein [Anaerolineales bacterium]